MHKKVDVYRAWRDGEYFEGLSEEERARLPEGPVGAIQLSDEELRSFGVKRLIADTRPGFPDRVELRDVERGEALLLLNYLHQPADTPYKASHAIFVREWAETPYRAVDEIPDVLRIRPISLRALDTSGDMVDADLIEGDLKPAIARLFADDLVYVHACGAVDSKDSFRGADRESPRPKWRQREADRGLHRHGVLRALLDERGHCGAMQALILGLSIARRPFTLRHEAGLGGAGELLVRRLCHAGVIGVGERRGPSEAERECDQCERFGH